MPKVSETLHITSLVGHVNDGHWVALTALRYPDLEQVGAALLVDVHTDTPVLSDVFVHAEHRRAGIGTELVRVAKRWADHNGRDLYLHVMPENPARQLYEAEGFEPTGEVKEDGAVWLTRCWGDGRLVGKEAPG